MKATPTAIRDAFILGPTVFADERGFFFESFSQKAFHTATGSDASFVQDNHSYSLKNVLRGLHYQRPPHEQGKLVRVVQGEVFDVAVDIRKESPSYGMWTGVKLSSANKKQFWLPPGLAHGFLVLSESADVIYKTTSYYAPSHERSLLWSDTTLNIAWPLDESPLVASKDEQGHCFAKL